ncbi:MAG: flavodoxin-dependent (E)-4-hydroxy-3-methylbut-2-enyl-diphosphate synthase [Bacilli bacterium]
MYKRSDTRKVNVGNLIIGGSDEVIIQSMITSLPRNIETCVKDINELAVNGCQLVRFAVLTKEDTDAIAYIKKQTNIPLVADIHFDYKLALYAIDAGIDKIRINPGNIGDDYKVAKVVDACKKKRIPIRIGVNAGSIQNEIVEKYGRHNAIALVESAKKHVKILEKYQFYDIIISIKASDVITTIEAYKLASKTFSYPLHLGLTEAGTSFSGTIKSAVAIGTILNENIGNTIRVSLSANPLEEIKVAKEILSSLNLFNKPKLISCPTCGRCQIDLVSIANEIEKHLDKINKNISVAVMGCVVNGPGEASNADIGIAGGGESVTLFKKGKKIKTVSSNDAVSTLLFEIDKL